MIYLLAPVFTISFTTFGYEANSRSEQTKKHSAMPIQFSFSSGKMRRFYSLCVCVWLSEMREKIWELLYIALKIFAIQQTEFNMHTLVWLCVCVWSSYYRNVKYLHTNRILICCCHTLVLRFICLFVYLPGFCYLVWLTRLVWLPYVCNDVVYGFIVSPGHACVCVCKVLFVA